MTARRVESSTGAVLVGTASWTDPTLLACGRFYPESARTPAARLAYYASHFPLVEVDSSYYSLPAEATARLWVERTPDNFVFDVKAFRLLTRHPTPLRSLPKDLRGALPAQTQAKANVYADDVPEEVLGEVWRRFEAALLPLDSAGKLGVVLFQFPPWFHTGRDNRHYIAELKTHLPQYPLAIEFRNALWLSEERRASVLSLLADNGLSLVCVDEPQGFASSLPPVAEATADIAIVRFHGRNRDTWQKRGISAAERFDYIYSEDELGEWLPRVRDLATKTRQVHILFNNCYEDKAVVNARQFAALFGQPNAA